MRALPIVPGFAGPIILCCGWLSPADVENVHVVFMLDASYQKKAVFLNLRQPFKAIPQLASPRIAGSIRFQPAQPAQPDAYRLIACRCFPLQPFRLSWQRMYQVVPRLSGG